MEIGFYSKKLRTLCENEREMTKVLGPKSARKLRARLADLRAAAMLGDVIVGRPHPLTGDRQGQFAVSLHGADRLVFEPTDEPVPTTKDGAIEWKRVTKIRIVFIGDYHG